MKPRHAILLSLACLALAAGAAAAGNHVIQAPTEVVWGPAPPFLPAGAEIAVLNGDPGTAVPYSVRLKFPAKYDIAAHSHPGDEHVVVVSGALHIGMGDKLDRKGGSTLAVGGFALMPAGMNHYAFTNEPTTIVLYGIGPVDFKYVNPADDPRNAKPAAK
jgi:quercetin dioxygenase-like cupin family protein